LNAIASTSINHPGCISAEIRTNVEAGRASPRNGARMQFSSAAHEASVIRCHTVCREGGNYVVPTLAGLPSKSLDEYAFPIDPDLSRDV
jgi:hypothetical protein